MASKTNIILKYYMKGNYENNGGPKFGNKFGNTWDNDGLCIGWKKMHTSWWWVGRQNWRNGVLLG